jgi:hypothetical protein
MAKSASIFWFLLFVAPLASAQIFKCVAKNGTDLYQNFPCGIDSIGSVATKAQSAKPGLPQGDLKQAKPSASAGVAAGKSITAQSEPRIGMTMEEVRAVWGEPMNFYQDELVDGRVEIWSYGTSRSVEFDLKGRVTAMRR